MSQKLLRDLDIHAHRPQVGGKRIAEAVPPYSLANDPRATECRANVPDHHHVREQRLFAVLADGGEQVILVFPVQGLQPPLCEDGLHRSMQRNRAATSLCLGIANVKELGPIPAVRFFSEVTLRDIYRAR